MTLRASALLLLLGAGTASAQDWPQWRGPNRDGAVAGFPERTAWPATLPSAWKVKVGIGHSSPVAVGPVVYVFSREGEEEALSSFDLATGKRLWRQAYAAPYTMNPAATSHGKGPKSTPVVSGGRVFTLGISGVLSSFDAATGKLVWRKDFSAEHKQTSPLYGAAMSPAVDGGLLIAHVGGPDDGALTAFDAATGAPRWSWKGDGPGYASPVIADIGGRRQVVTQTQSYVVGLSADKGELLWKVPFKTAYDQNAVTPLVEGGTVIYSGLDNGVHAVHVVKKGTAWAAEPGWDTSEVSMYLSSPVADGDRLYGFSHKKKGQFFALDARTGQVLWLSEGRQGDNAAVVVAGPVLFLLTSDGNLTVARKDAKSWSPLRTYTVADSPTWAHPVVTAKGILVKDAESLAFWRLD
jgi:outer membrane protein assembly factor BamB